MAATAGYQAGIEANQTQYSYAVEAVWGSRPTTVAFNAIRYTSSTLALTKTRARPSEINLTREVSQAVTTEQIAGGSINYAFSWGTYDDLLGSLFQGDWTTPYLIQSIGTDISVTSGGGTSTFTSTLSGKFTNIQIGQFIKTNGFVGAYNGFTKVLSKADNQNFVVASQSAGGSETSAGTNVKITGSTLNNGTTFKSLFIQQKFSPSKFFRYAGAYVTRWTLSVDVGNFFTGAFDIIAKNEASSTSDASTFGPVVAAPTNTVFDPVAGWVSVRFVNQANFVGAIDQFALTVENTAAAPEFSLGGTAGAIGILGGTLMGSGTMRLYCADFTVYDQFVAETYGDLTVIVRDAQMNSYVITMRNVFMMCRIPVGGPGQAVMIEITYECNPAAAGGTIQIDRHVTTGAQTG